MDILLIFVRPEAVIAKLRIELAVFAFTRTALAWPYSVLNYTPRQSRAMLLSYSGSNSNNNFLKSDPSNQKFSFFADDVINIFDYNLIIFKSNKSNH